jgi:hypothetical protein
LEPPLEARIEPDSGMSEQCEAIFEQLAERGLLVSGHKVEELVEQRAQERLSALKQEHGIPA